MAENRQYDHEYKVQAVKPQKKLGKLRLPKNRVFPRHHVWLGAGQPPGQS